MEFMDRIKEIRIENNLTQSALAVLVDKGEGAVRAWESGRSKPDADTLIRLSKNFNCSSDYLLGLSEHKSIGDFQKAVRNTDKIVKNIEKLNRSGDSYDFFYILNLCFESMINSPLTDKNGMFFHWVNLLTAFSNISLFAKMLNTEIKEIEMTYDEGIVIPDFRLSTLVSFIKSEDRLSQSITYMYNEHAEWILNNIKNESERKAIENLLF